MCAQGLGRLGRGHDALADMWRKEPVEHLAGPIQLMGERCEIALLVDACPGDVNAGTTRELGMDGHDRASIAVKEAVCVSKQPHHLARPPHHALLVLGNVQGIFRSAPDILRVREEIETAGLADRHVRQEIQAVAAGPGIIIPEQAPMRLEQVTITQRRERMESIERLANAQAEDVVFLASARTFRR